MTNLYLEMSEEEFKELLNKLHQLGLDDGDLGFAYWTKVIKELKAMRAICNAKGND